MKTVNYTDQRYGNWPAAALQRTAVSSNPTRYLLSHGKNMEASSFAKEQKPERAKWMISRIICWKAGMLLDPENGSKRT